MLSYQSLIPAGAGTPRYEEPELWVGTANWDGGFCHAAPRPQRGTSPRATFPPPHPQAGLKPAATGTLAFGRRTAACARRRLL